MTYVSGTYFHVLKGHWDSLWAHLSRQGIPQDSTLQVAQVFDKTLTPTLSVVNVTDLMIFDNTGSHPHALDEHQFCVLHVVWTKNRPMHFNYHGYPIKLDGLLFGRSGSEKRKSWTSAMNWKGVSCSYIVLCFPGVVPQSTDLHIILSTTLGLHLEWRQLRRHISMYCAKYHLHPFLAFHIFWAEGVIQSWGSFLLIPINRTPLH